ncbi:hypothetical protein [Pseudomonas lini]
MSYIRKLRQQCNERHGVYCYGNHNNPNLWSLWCDDRSAESGIKETELIPWRDLGPGGMIWVEWAGHEYEQWAHRDEMMVVIEYRDDTVTPPVARSGLMHLPSGRETGLIFEGNSISFEVGDDVLFFAWPLEGSIAGTTGYALYDRNLRELFAPAIASVITPPRNGRIELIVRFADGSTKPCLYDYMSQRYIIPAQYDSIEKHKGLWFCSSDSDRCDVRDANGMLIASYDHQIFKGFNRLYAKKNELWGWADESGQLIGQPFAASAEILEAQPVEIIHLNVDTTSVHAFRLNSHDLERLTSNVGEAGCTIKYEGIPTGFGDGYIDGQRVILPKQGLALLLSDRYGHEDNPALRLIILIKEWHDLPAGTVMAWNGKTQAKLIEQESSGATFLQALLAQSIDWLS